MISVGSSEPEVPLVSDSFLTGILGKSVYRLVRVGRVRSVIDSLRQEKSWMVEAKVPVEEVNTTAALTGLGFCVIDTNVQLDCPTDALNMGPLSRGISIRESCRDDRSFVERVAGDNLTTSRFHSDRRIGAGLGRRIKEIWAGNYFDGCRGDDLLVAERDGAVGGFLLVLERDSVGIIDLIALDPTLRGSGAVGALIACWLRRAPAIRRVVVGTQIANTRSLRAYGKMGFRVRGAAHVLHRHEPEGAA